MIFVIFCDFSVILKKRTRFFRVRPSPSLNGPASTHRINLHKIQEQNCAGVNRPQMNNARNLGSGNRKLICLPVFIKVFLYCGYECSFFFIWLNFECFQTENIF